MSDRDDYDRDDDRSYGRSDRDRRRSPRDDRDDRCKLNNNFIINLFNHINSTSIQPTSS